MRLRRLSWRGRIAYLASMILIAFAMAGIGFVWWAAQTMEAMPEALVALESDETVVVDYAVWLTFTPRDVQPTRGFVFYPGARVDPRAYAPAAHAIAAEGYLVIIPPMPLNLALLAPNRANEIVAAYPEIDHWAIGGHSMGGAMANNYVARQFTTDISNHFDLLILWGAYASANVELATETELAVTVIYGTNDGYSTVAEVESRKIYLPPTTTYVAIEGGNHSQFGWYGFQEGDGEATISYKEQQTQAIAATLNALAESQD